MIQKRIWRRRKNLEREVEEERRGCGGKKTVGELVPRLKALGTSAHNIQMG